MKIELRNAVREDRPRILEISSQIWEGNDYLPLVIDDWLADSSGEFVVAVVDGVLVGFAHRRSLAPRYAWLEGIRTDPARRGTGAAKEITLHLLEAAREDGADRVGLSTHVLNEASMHIARSHGFEEVARFTNLGAEKSAPAWSAARESREVVEVPLDEAVAFTRKSRSLELGRGFVSNGWTFYPFDRTEDGALRQARHLLGVRDRGRLVAFLAGGYVRQGNLYPIHLLEGEEEAVRTLICHALFLARGCEYADLMAPRRPNDLGLEPVLTDLGFKPWVATIPDVFILERSL